MYRVFLVITDYIIRYKSLLYIVFTVLGALIILGPIAYIVFLMLWHGMPLGSP